MFGGFRFEDSHLAWHKYAEKSSDKVIYYLNAVKATCYTNNILNWELKNKLESEKFDVLDYIEYGKLMSGVLQEEVAFQCYYMAHLKDPDNIKTNAELAYDTLIFKN